ncbi:S41 family peptidase [Streptomyces hokutonensis]|uniref:S41 family peptidase n=1 Tax=Streptomyces hokutonensis TaxID=1306990 RepID=UPI0033C08D79
MAPAARTYLSKALDIMEEHSLLRREVDWADLRKKAFAQARGARKPADTYGAISSALWSLGDEHSTLSEPKPAKEQLASPAVDLHELEGRSLKNGIGYLSLPGARGSQEAYDKYVQRGRAAVAKADENGACGWVVDLRSETGGGMWPVLAVVGPILGDGKVGMFVDADGKKYTWSIKNGAPYEDGKSQGWSDARPVVRSSPPVAVLTGQGTASAGEAIVVAFRGRPKTRSFGEPTRGVPTGNKAYRLSDTALINLTEAKDADRTGRTYDEAIPPDEEIARNPLARARDDVLRAAQDWLLKESACARP